MERMVGLVEDDQVAAELIGTYLRQRGLGARRLPSREVLAGRANLEALDRVLVTPLENQGLTELLIDRLKEISPELKILIMADMARGYKLNPRPGVSACLVEPGAGRLDVLSAFLTRPDPDQ